MILACDVLRFVFRSETRRRRLVRAGLTSGPSRRADRLYRMDRRYLDFSSQGLVEWNGGRLSHLEQIERTRYAEVEAKLLG